MAEPPVDPAKSDDLDAPKDSQRRLIDRLPGGSPGLRTPSLQDAIPGLRVPKERIRIAADSLELPNALALLTEQVRKAEQFLRKQPGADRAQAALDHVYLPELHVGTVAFLETRFDEQGNCQIVVKYYHTGSDSSFSTAKLDEFPISTRIELCKAIPTLVESAVAAKSVLANDVITVADAIADAIQRHRDNTI